MSAHVLKISGSVSARQNLQVQMISLSSAKWTCNSCLNRASLHRNYATRSVFAARPAHQRLSKNASKPDGDVKKARPKPRESLSRMSKTQVSVLSDVLIHDRVSSRVKSAEVDDFKRLRLLPEVTQGILDGALKSLEYANPTLIQAIAIPALLKASRKSESSSFLLAAETGSGKTLAYLAPLLNELKIEEMSGDTKREIGKPRSIILLPSIELVKQIGKVVKTMSYSAKVSSTILLPEFSFKRAKNQLLNHPIDVLVTMPHQLNKMIDEGLIRLDNAKFVVVDEADTLLDVSFQEIVTPILESTTAIKTLTLCSATIPRSLDAYLRKNYPNIERLVSPKLHSIPRRIAMRFVDVEKEFQGNKNMACLQVLRDLCQDGAEPDKVKKVLLFVNKRETIQTLSQWLEEHDIQVVQFSRDTEARDEVIKDFMVTDEEVTEDPLSRMKVMVTTDLASRGIDTIAVKNVLIYDVPYSTIDLIHRVGRTGRAGRRGRAFVLVTKEKGSKWIRDVKHLVISGQPLV